MEQIARTTKQIGSIVQRERRRKKLSQKELGKKMSLRQATVSKLESGSPATQLQTLLDALTALNLEIAIRPRTHGSIKDIGDIF